LVIATTGFKQMRRHTLLVCVAQNESPEMTLDMHDGAFVNWLCAQIFPQPAPSDGHCVTYINRVEDVAHYMPLADAFMFYYSNSLRQNPKFMCLCNELSIAASDREHVLHREFWNQEVGLGKSDITTIAFMRGDRVHTRFSCI